MKILELYRCKVYIKHDHFKAGILVADFQLAAGDKDEAVDMVREWCTERKLNVQRWNLKPLERAAYVPS